MKNMPVTFKPSGAFDPLPTVRVAARRTATCRCGWSLTTMGRSQTDSYEELRVYIALHEVMCTSDMYPGKVIRYAASCETCRWVVETDDKKEARRLVAAHEHFLPGLPAVATKRR